MTKVFQVVNGICHHDSTMLHATINDVKWDRYPVSVIFAEAPDYVREGWGYDETGEGDARFIEPAPPEGWLYDRESGTFYEDPGYVPPAAEPNPEEMEQALNILGVQTRETNP